MNEFDWLARLVLISCFSMLGFVVGCTVGQISGRLERIGEQLEDDEGDSDR